MSARAMMPVSQVHTLDVDGLDESLWLDLECPSEAERLRFGELLGEPIPDEADVSEFEASSRFFISRNAVHLRTFCLAERDNEKLRFCLMDQQQTLANLNRHRILEGQNKERLAALLGDIQSLIDHSEGILQRISLHASMVMSRTQLADSRVTKVFSVIAILFLPPTMIASIYGMNFQSMPELTWPHGYAMAIGLMALSGVAPLLFFKHRHWL